MLVFWATIDDCLDALPDRFRGERGDWYLPRCGRRELRGGENLVTDQLVDRTDADLQPFCRLIHRDRLGSLYSRIERCDPEPLAQFPHADGSPGLAVGGLAAHPVHCDGDLAVGPLAAELANGFNRADLPSLRVASAANSCDALLGVAAAHPVDRHN